MRSKSLYLLCLLFTLSAFAEDSSYNVPSSSLAGTSGLLSTIVNGSVSAITGELVDSQTDLVLPGPEPLILRRTYSSMDESYGYLHHAWQLSAPSLLTVERYHVNQETARGWKTVKHYEAVLGEPSGAQLSYNATRHHYVDWIHVPLKEVKGLINCANGEISARTNLKNQKFLIGDDLLHCHVHSAPGESRFFTRHSKKKDRTIMHLDRETKASGHQLLYRYEDHALKQMIAAHEGTGAVYSHLTFDYQGKKEKPVIQVTSSDERFVKYFFQRYSDTGAHRFYLTHVQRTDKPSETYQYKPKYSKGEFRNDKARQHIWRKELPEGRYIETSYYHKGNNNLGDLCTLQLAKADPRINRVREQRAPVGVDQTPIITHRFHYHINTEKEEVTSGYTDVYDAYGHLIRYRYDENHRPIAIEKFKGVHGAALSLYSQEEYQWSEDRLTCKSFKSSTGEVHSARWFKYDAAGNILSEHLCGNLSGNSPGETYSKHFTYGEAHLLLSEKEDNGRKIICSYQPGTDLITSRLLLDHEKIILRQFYTYEAGVLTHIIVDDGSSVHPHDLAGVTERRLTHIYPRATAPMGVPERIDECYLDLQTGQEHLIKRCFSAYSLQGRLLKQDHYDCNGVYRYTLTWDYDAHGNVIQETNALGQLFTKKYDANDNLIFEQGPGLDHYIQYKYDFSNRLIAKEEFHADGTLFITSHRYDFLGNRIATVDPFGHETFYNYDEFGRVVQTVGPAIAYNHSLIRPITHTSYDITNHPITQTDANGNVTTTTYNARGKPTTITKPDGTVEHFAYALDGQLLRTTAPNGTLTQYTHDILGRILSEEVIFKGELLSKTTSIYNAFHLLSTTDAEGLTTYYKYNPAGQLIEISANARRTSFEYDPLGRLIKKIEHSATESITHTLAYDLLNRITEERTATEHLSQSCKEYAYDSRGNCIQTTIHTDTKPQTTYTEYNSRNQPIKIVDALNQTTYITYNPRHQNQHGQQVLQVETTDPLGNRTITTHDPLGRVAATQKKNPFGILTAKQEWCYDLAGNRIHILDTVLFQGAEQRKILATFEYNSVNQITALYEAVGTPEQKTTRYTYNSYGQKAAQIKPDGCHILYTYDPQGRVSRFYASDHSFDYSYTYNRCHLPTEINDSVHQATLKRSYDSFGNLTTETFSPEITLSYAYDPIGRLTSLTLPDSTGIHYAYQGHQLKEVQRLINNIPVYSHTYAHYDLSGTLTSSQLPQQAGCISYQYDALQRLTHITTANWSQTLSSYDLAGNLRASTIRDLAGQLDCTFSYDDLYQLTSETGVHTHTYSHDSLNNRLTKDDQFHEINALNQLLKQTDCCYHYDLNGNLIQKVQNEQITTYTYDALDRLIAVQEGETLTTYTYDAFNRRLTKNHQGHLTYTLYQGQNEIGTLSSGTIQELRLLGIGKGAEIGAAIALELNHTVYIPIHDHQGHLAALKDTQGHTLEIYRYTAFGEEKIYDHTGTEQAFSINPWRFASKRKDPETGFIYFGRRYYLPETGRWLTPDPIGFDDGPNLYAYLRNNPLTHFDLYGLADATPEKAKESEAKPRSHLQSDRFNKDERTENNTSVPHEVTERFKDIWRGFSDPLSELSEIADELRGGERQRSFSSRACGGVGVSLFAATAVVAGVELAAGKAGVAAISLGRQALYAGGRALGRAATRYGLNRVKESQGKPQTERAISPQASKIEKNVIDNIAKTGGRNRFTPDKNAVGPHTVFRRNSDGLVTHYETFQPQTNPLDPKTWKSVKRYDGSLNHPHKHYNKITGQDIPTPHVHDPSTSGGIRIPKPWEIP